MPYEIVVESLLGGESRVIQSDQEPDGVLVFETWKEARDEIIMQLREVSAEIQVQIARLGTMNEEDVRDF